MIILPTVLNSTIAAVTSLGTSYSRPLDVLTGVVTAGILAAGFMELKTLQRRRHERRFDAAFASLLTLLQQHANSLWTILNTKRRFWPLIRPLLDITIIRLQQKRLSPSLFNAFKDSIDNLENNNTPIMIHAEDPGIGAKEHEQAQFFGDWLDYVISNATYLRRALGSVDFNRFMQLAFDMADSYVQLGQFERIPPLEQKRFDTFFYTFQEGVNTIGFDPSSSDSDKSVGHSLDSSDED